ncbi:MAG: hypothetical protein JSS11_16150 [Verrucomicrobia bacterium]|nr:hypothetical protein [Verrucomicrobiota bacterium]
MRKIITSVLIIALSCPLFAHRDRLGKISQAELTFEDGGVVCLTKDRHTLLSLALRTDAGTAEVKKEDLAGIDLPQLDSMRMTWSTFTSGDLAGVSYKVITFRFGPEEKKTFGEYPEVSFYFYDGHYHHRGLRTKTSEHSWKIADPSPGPSLIKK